LKKILVVFLALFGLALVYALTFPSTGQAQWGPGEHISDDLVACWDMEEESGTRYDAVGDNDLTDNNTVARNNGLVNYAADFDDSNDEYLSRGHGPEFVWNSFTVVIWVKPDDNDTSKFISKYGESGTLYSEWFLQSKDDQYRFFVTDGEGNNNELWEGEVSPEYTLVVALYDNESSQIGIIVNADELITDTFSMSPDTPADFQVSSTFYNGQIDTTAIWRRALSLDELTWIYNSGQGRPCSHLITGPTPTPTPTPPAGVSIITLPDGEQFYIGKTISYGDVGVYVLLLSLILFCAIYGLIWLTRRGVGT